MKIALISQVSLSSFGGAERKLVEAAEMLVQRGNEVHMYALPYTHPDHRVKGAFIVASLQDRGIEYQERNRHELIADVVYAVYAPFILRKFKSSCPVVAGLHSPLLFTSESALETFINPVLAIRRYKSPKYIGSFWLSNIVKGSDLRKFCAVRTLSPVFKVKHENAFCIPDWVDSGVFRPQSKKDDTFTVFFAGRHHWEKGFDTFLKIAHTLKRKGLKMNFRCTLEGVGPVEGVGFLDDDELARTYSASHLVIYPSRLDTFGGVIVEASACGTPVLTTPLPVHSLGLSLLYAGRLTEFVEATVRVYNMWETNTGLYEKFAQVLRNQALAYDVSQIFPIFEFMLEQVAKL